MALSDMPDRDEFLDENHRLQAVTQQTRARVVESKLAVTRTLCTAAETYVSIGDSAQAGSLIQLAEQMAASAESSIASSHNLPLALLHSQLAEVKKRIRDLKSRLG